MLDSDSLRDASGSSPEQRKQDARGLLGGFQACVGYHRRQRPHGRLEQVGCHCLASVEIERHYMEKRARGKIAGLRGNDIPQPNRCSDSQLVGRTKLCRSPNGLRATSAVRQVVVIARNDGQPRSACNGEPADIARDDVAGQLGCRFGGQVVHVGFPLRLVPPACSGKNRLKMGVRPYSRWKKGMIIVMAKTAKIAVIPKVAFAQSA